VQLSLHRSVWSGRGRRRKGACKAGLQDGAPTSLRGTCLSRHRHTGRLRGAFQRPSLWPPAGGRGRTRSCPASRRRRLVDKASRRPRVGGRSARRRGRGTAASRGRE
jgi:hypothetical protein